MWTGLESRKFPRLKTNCQIFLQNDSERKSLISSTENIGVGGLCVIINQPLSKMSQVKIELDLQDGKEPIQCEGRVAWTVRKRSFNLMEHGHDTGIEFVNLSAEAARRIQELVGRFVAGKK